MITRKQEAQFRYIVGLLNTFIKEVRLEEPNAEYYLDGSGWLNLMTGPHHDGSRATARPENIQCRVELHHSDAGDW